MIKNNYKLFIGIIGISVAAILSLAFSQDFPPDNAAVLYLRAFVIYEEPGSKELSDKLNDFRLGKVEPDKEIREYCKKCEPVIELVTTASQIQDCDWGQDFSKGFDLLMPELATVRKLAFVMIYDAKVSQADGDYITSLERSMTIHRMAKHVGNNMIISNMVGVALNALANGQIQSVLSEMPDDVETLEWLKSQLFDISANTPSLIAAIVNESKISLNEIRKEKINEILSSPEASEIMKTLPEEMVEAILKGDESFFDEGRQYFLDFIASVKASFDLPYEDAQKELIKLNEKIQNDTKSKAFAMFASTMSPAISKVCTNEIRRNTDLNATNAAIDIYIYKVKNGKLPDKLPVGLPKDMFSSKDFLYEKTDDGFILRCQGKDLTNNVVHEYEFKVK